MGHYYLTGDCHRDFGKVEFFCKCHGTSKDDYMIVLGDAGVNYCLDGKDRELKKRLSGLPISFLMIHGNHEQRPFCVPGYREREWHGGIVYWEEEFPSLLFAKDGEIYDFGEKRELRSEARAAWIKISVWMPVCHGLRPRSRMKRLGCM